MPDRNPTILISIVLQCYGSGYEIREAVFFYPWIRIRDGKKSESGIDAFDGWGRGRQNLLILLTNGIQDKSGRLKRKKNKASGVDSHWLSVHWRVQQGLSELKQT